MWKKAWKKFIGRYSERFTTPPFRDFHHMSRQFVRERSPYIAFPREKIIVLLWVMCAEVNAQRLKTVQIGVFQSELPCMIFTAWIVIYVQNQLQFMKASGSARSWNSNRKWIFFEIWFPCGQRSEDENIFDNIRTWQIRNFDHLVRTNTVSFIIHFQVERRNVQMDYHSVYLPSYRCFVILHLIQIMYFL